MLRLTTAGRICPAAAMPTLPPAITQAEDAMSIEGPAPRSPLTDRALPAGRVP
jgi:hypothetical protein